MYQDYCLVVLFLPARILMTYIMTCWFAQHVSKHKCSTVPVYAWQYIVSGIGSSCILGWLLSSQFPFLSACTTAFDLEVWKCPKGAFERNIQGHNSIVNCLDLGFRQATCQPPRFSNYDWIYFRKFVKLCQVAVNAVTWLSCRSVSGSTIREGQQGSSQLIAGTDNGYLHFWDCWLLCWLCWLWLFWPVLAIRIVPTPIHHPCSTGLEKWPQVSELGGSATTFSRFQIHKRILLVPEWLALPSTIWSVGLESTAYFRSSTGKPFHAFWFIGLRVQGDLAVWDFETSVVNIRCWSMLIRCSCCWWDRWTCRPSHSLAAWARSWRSSMHNFRVSFFALYATPCRHNLQRLSYAMVCYLYGVSCEKLFPFQVQRMRSLTWRPELVLHGQPEQLEGCSPCIPLLGPAWVL